MKLFRALLATFLFAIILAATYYIHVIYFHVDVVLYSAVLDGVIATALATLCLVAFRFFHVLGSFEKLQLVVIWLIAGYAFAISVPTVIDRSLSLYILEKLDQRGGGIRQDRMGEVFTREYLKEHRLVDVRLTEQLESGTITIEEGCVRLTDKGRHIAHFGRFFRMNLLPRNRLLMGSYSDDLTDPFRNSEPSPDYIC